ncbi:MAG TPA: hypothetical protein VF982_04690 [Anaerolineales bacterium]
MRIEVRQVPETLHEEDHPGPRARRSLGVRLDKQPRGNAPKPPERGPVHSEHRPQPPREGEHVLAVRHGLEDILLDPLALQEPPLLVAARAEVAGLAGPGEQVIVPAGVAVDAGQAMVQVTALDEAFEHLRFDCAAQPASLAQLPGMAPRALPPRARAWVARAVYAHARRDPIARCASPFAHARANARRVPAATRPTQRLLRAHRPAGGGQPSVRKTQVCAPPCRTLSSSNT